MYFFPPGKDALVYYMVVWGSRGGGNEKGK